MVQHYWEGFIPVRIFTMEIFTNEFINKVVSNSLILAVTAAVCGLHCRKLIHFTIILGKFPAKYAEAAPAVTSRKEELCF